MKSKSSLHSMRRFIAMLLVAALTGAALPPPAHANEAVRSAARATLVRYGVEPGEAAQRVAALTDEEAAQLAGAIAELPAGGDDYVRPGGAYNVLGLIAIVVAILIIMRWFRSGSESRAPDAPDL